ncbi:hypothetical protein CCMSSC00406_0007127 [Pleurotus cornucopiae]|uniref:Uncharacterized protein n=1 Tax=Pleurotus cornucopiae TaxID=5321 RepID=A0ACB7IPN0_PLECO|nr:hypothetical protein CCMSSC00406_0007127 [Pleurotus cornucopiae]
MRQLSLHVSALNDSEYDFYTTSLIDLAEDESEPTARNNEYFDNLAVGVREARAWMKGRFSHIPVSKIDEILRLFSPNMSAGDTLSGGQFFAALRLALHVENGREVDRGLAFAQAFPRTESSASPPKRTLPMPPMSPPMLPATSAPHTPNNPFSQAQSFSALQQEHPSPHPNPFNPFVGRSSSQSTGPPQKLPPLPPRKPSIHQPPPRHASQVPPVPDHAPRGHVSTPSLTKPAHVTSALMKQSLQASKVGQTLKRAEEQLEKERILQVLKSSNSNVGRARSNSPHKPPPPPPPRPTSSSGSGSEVNSSSVPPLPKRRSFVDRARAASPPVSTTSLEEVAFARPHVNTNVSHGYAASPFKTPDQAFKEASYFTRSPSVSPTRSPNKDLPPPKHPRRKPPPPIESAFSSTSSALSSADSTSSTTLRDRQRGEDLNQPLNDSPTSRIFRSKSVHYPSPPPPVPPPLRKRRPESVQVLGGLASLEHASQNTTSPFPFRGPRSEGGSNGSVAGNGALLSRHVSMSASTPSPRAPHYRNSAQNVGGVDNGESPFHRTLATLQPKLDALQPKLDKVRYKAEAGLSRRGFVRERGWREGEDEQGLMGGTRSGQRDSPSDSDGWERIGGMDGGPDVDSGDEGSNTTNGNDERGRRLNGPRDPGQPLFSEKDNLKLPPGDGWKPL